MWDTIDVEDPAKVKELYELLTYNYVEDQEATMRFAYSAEFLDWCVRVVPAPGALPCTAGARADERALHPGCAWATNRALKPPGYVRDWQVGVRVKSTGKLVAFISGIPVALRARTKCVR